MRTSLIFVLSVLALAVPASAQERERLEINSYGAVLDNIDLLIDHYANFLARKYELTEEQDQYTRHLLRERSHEFLDSHEDDLRGLIETLFEVRTGGDMSPEGLMSWGESARPIYDQARELIIAGNDDWREILTPEQKAKHDEDLKLMWESFETTETQLDRITTGEMTVDEFRNPRRARSVRRSTARATPDDVPPPPPPSNRLDQPTDEETSIARERARALRERLAERRREQTIERAGREDRPDGMDPPPPAREVKRAQPNPATERGGRDNDERRGARTTDPERSGRDAPPPRPTRRTARGKEGETGAWDKYVEDFIKLYQLDDAQTQQARSILDDCKQQADRYLKSKEDTIARIDRDLETLKKDKDPDKAKRRAADIKKLTDQKEKLRSPVDRIFEKQLKPRLDRIPTRAQTRAAEESKNKKTKRPGRRGKDD